MRKFVYRLAIILVLTTCVTVWLVLLDRDKEKDSLTNFDELDRTEEIEKNRIRDFFTELKSYYRYVYDSEGQSTKYFIQFDEALLQGEVSGTLYKIEDNERKEYEIAGITDGIIIKLYTEIDGEQLILNGDIRGDASLFEVSFSDSAKVFMFHAMTKEEFHKTYNEE